MAEFAETSKLLEALAGVGDYMPSLYIKFTITAILELLVAKEGNALLTKYPAALLFSLQKLVQLLTDRDPEVRSRARAPLLALLKGTDRHKFAAFLRRKLSENEQTVLLTHAE